MRDVRMGVILVGNSRNVAPSEGCSQPFAIEKVRHFGNMFHDPLIVSVRRYLGLLGWHQLREGQAPRPLAPLIAHLKKSNCYLITTSKLKWDCYCSLVQLTRGCAFHPFSPFGRLLLRLLNLCQPCAGLWRFKDGKMVPDLQALMSNGIYLNVCVVGECVNGLKKGHFFYNSVL